MATPCDSLAKKIEIKNKDTIASIQQQLRQFALFSPFFAIKENGHYKGGEKNEPATLWGGNRASWRDPLHA
jgi:hypothetical protein